MSSSHSQAWRCRACQTLNTSGVQCQSCPGRRASFSVAAASPLANSNSGSNSGSHATAVSPSASNISMTEVVRKDPSVPALPSMQYDTDLPPDWQRVYDHFGREYYVNHITQESQWDRPQAQAPVAAPLAFLRRASTHLFVQAPPSYEVAVSDGGANPDVGFGA